MTQINWKAVLGLITLFSVYKEHLCKIVPSVEINSINGTVNFIVSFEFIFCAPFAGNTQKI